tara:strand:+ start:1201 stop:1677 length:477 start_codon:yes stop_codon:yes gene_type:complete
MDWQEILKANCSTHKLDYDDKCPSCREKMNKRLVGGQKKLDKDKDGKITGKDFAMLRDNTKKAKTKCPQCKGKGCAHCDDKGYHISKGHKSDSQIEKEILAEIKKEGGALGMKNLKPICPSDDLERVLNSMKKKGTIFMHKDGDIYTHKPSRGRGFTA